MINKLVIKIPKHIVIACSAWLSRLCTASVQLLVIGILLPYLGKDDYAVFVLVVGLMGWFSLVDMGLGNSIQNFIAESRGRKKNYSIYIFYLGIVSVGILFITELLLYIFSGFISEIFLGKFEFIANSEASRLIFMACSFSIAVNVGGISYKIWYAENKGYLSNLAPALASLISLFSILLVSVVKPENALYWSLFSYFSPPAVIALSIYAWHLRNLKWKEIKENKWVFKKLIGRALKFWVYALMATVTLQIDYLVLSQYISSGDIVIYSISMKVYGFAGYIFGAILLALMPIMTEKFSAGDHSVNKIIWDNLKIGLAFMVFSTFVISFGLQYVVGYFMPKEQLIFPISFLLLAGIYHIIRSWTDTFAAILQSITYMRGFFIWVPIQALLTVLLTFLLGKNYGINGVIIGLLLGFLFTVSWALPYYANKKLNLFTSKL